MNEKELLKQIKSANLAYRKGTPTISDAEYDAMIEQLRSINPNNKWFKQIEPSPVKESRKEKLSFPMRSLDKVKSLEELRKWVSKQQKSVSISLECMMVIMPKYNGISLLIEEVSGGGQKAWTRGGSENEGQNVSDHFRLVKSKQCGFDHFHGGEAIISRANWNTYFKDKTPYNIPLGAVSGMFNADDVNPLLQYVDYIPYIVFDEIVSYSNTLRSLMMDRDRDDHVVIPIACLFRDDAEELFQKLYDQWNTEYDCDGLVFSFDDANIRNILGRQENGNPNYSVAYKANFEKKYHTKVIGINVEVAKDGKLCPTVQVEPVEIDGAIVDNPTGYNFRWLHEMGINVGAEVVLIKSGGVIPKIVEVTKKSEEPYHCTYCPDCGSIVAMDSKQINMCCNYPYCSGRIASKFMHFFTVMGFENLGESFFKSVVKGGFGNLYSLLIADRKRLEEIDGVGAYSANQFIMQVQKMYETSVPLARILHASDCFEGIGEKKAQLILEYLDSKNLGFGCYDELYDKCTKGIGQATIDSYKKGVDKLLADYLFLVDMPTYITKPKEAPTSNKYEGWSVCFSGVRDKDLENEIEAGGGSIVSGVSKKTTHLIVADHTESGKYKKAVELGVKIMLIDEFK